MLSRRRHLVADELGALLRELPHELHGREELIVRVRLGGVAGHRRRDLLRLPIDLGEQPAAVVARRGAARNLVGHLGALEQHVEEEIPADSPPGDTRGWVLREIDRQSQQITPAVLADPNKPYSNDEFQAAVAFVREFVIQRPGLVRNQVATSR